jgi:hypothetical protein
MKSLKAGLAVLLFMGSTATAAQERTDNAVERDVVLQGTAPAACVIRVPSSGNEQNATLSQSGSGGVNVELTPQGFIDPQTGVPRASGISLAIPITCNGPHHIRVSSARGSLLREGASSTEAAIRSELNFNVALEWAGLSSSFNTDSARSLDLPVADAATGTARVTISIPGGGSPLAAGAYTDTLVVEVETSS